jgi:hypothetical protein
MDFTVNTLTGRQRRCQWKTIYRLYRKSPSGGRIVNAETGAPVKRFEIRSGTPYDWKFFSASDGAFELDYASEVQVRAKGYCIHYPKVPPIQERSDFFLEIALKPGKALSGRVLSADNRPASKATLPFLLPDEEVLIEGATIKKRIAAVPALQQLRMPGAGSRWRPTTPRLAADSACFRMAGTAFGQL